MDVLRVEYLSQTAYGPETWGVSQEPMQNVRQTYTIQAEEQPLRHSLPTHENERSARIGYCKQILRIIELMEQHSSTRPIVRQDLHLISMFV